MAAKKAKKATDLLVDKTKAAPPVRKPKLISKSKKP